MLSTRKLAAATVIAAATLFATTACITPPSVETPTEPEQSTDTDTGTETEPSTETEPATEPETDQGTDDPAREAALQGYVDAEIAGIPQIQEQLEGVYAEINISGQIESSDGSGELPAGDVAVMYYDYVYADQMDWTATASGLDAQSGQLDTACTDQIFPAMEQQGVTGPWAAVWTYGDVASGGPQWTHVCSGE